MNTTLNTFTQNQIAEMKFADLATNYNTFAKTLGIKTIKKFKDKATGQARLANIQQYYLEELAQFQASEKAVADKAEPAKADARSAYSDDTMFSATGKVTKSVPHNIILACVANNMNASEIMEQFINEYSLETEKVEVTAKLAKGYVTGALRRGLIVISE